MLRRHRVIGAPIGPAITQESRLVASYGHHSRDGSIIWRSSVVLAPGRRYENSVFACVPSLAQSSRRRRTSSANDYDPGVLSLILGHDQDTVNANPLSASGFMKGK